MRLGLRRRGYTSLRTDGHDVPRARTAVRPCALLQWQILKMFFVGNLEGELAFARRPRPGPQPDPPSYWHWRQQLDACGALPCTPTVNPGDRPGRDRREEQEKAKATISDISFHPSRARMKVVRIEAGTRCSPLRALRPTSKAKPFGSKVLSRQSAD